MKTMLLSKTTKFLHNILGIKYKQIILYISIGIMGIGLTVFSMQKPSTSDDGSIISLTGGSNNESGSDAPKASDSTTPTQSATPTITATPSPTLSPTPTPNPLEKDAYPEVNTLVEAYYTAKLECNIDDFADLVTDVSLIDIEYMQKQYELVKSFQNFSCYTKNGIGDIAYVVYVSYDSEIATITTLVPSLDRISLAYNKDGELRVYMEEPSAEIEAYYEELLEDKEVKALSAKVQEQFDAALASDEDLQALYDRLSPEE